MNYKIKKIFMICIMVVLLVCMSGCGRGNDKTVKQKVAVDEFNKDITIDETLLLDEKGIVVTATELTYGQYCAELHLHIENNSDKNYVVSVGGLGEESKSINGHMITGGYIDELVNAGDSCDAIMEFGYSELRSKGIYEISEITMGFGLMLEKDYNNIDRYWPYVIKTSSSIDKYEPDAYKQAVIDGTYNLLYETTLDSFEEELIYSENGIEIVSEAIVTNEYGEKTLLLEVVNNSEDIYISYVENVYLNGILVCDSELTKNTIFPGTRNIVEIRLYYFMGEDSELDITEFEDIKFDFILRNKNFQVVLDGVAVEYE